MPRRHVPALNMWVSDDAKYQALHTAIFSGLSAIGWTRTSDTGQVVEASVTRPSMGGLSAPSVWRLDDGVAGMPLYMCLWIGRHAGYPNLPMFAVQFGTASNGACVIGGKTHSPYYVSGGWNAPADYTQQLAMSCDDGRFALALVDEDIIQTRTLISVERSFDQTNSPTDDGLLVLVNSHNYGWQMIVLPKTGTVPGGQTDCRSFFPIVSAGQTSADDRKAYGAGQWCVNGKTFYTRTLVYRHTDLPEGSVQNVDLYAAANAPYRCLGDCGPQLDVTNVMAIPWTGPDA